MSVYNLIFQLCGLKNVFATMGPTATEAALIELHKGIEQILINILQGVEPLSFHPKESVGCWIMEFTFTLTTPLMENEDQHLETIVAAATQLSGALAREVFGSATAGLASLRVGFLPGKLADLEVIPLEKSFIKAYSETEEKLLEGLIQEDKLRTFLQPIVSFPDGQIIGFEALTRGPVGSALERADQLFGVAAQSGLTLALEKACVKKAMQWINRYTGDKWISVNVSAGLLQDLEVCHWLARPGIVVEITEHLPLGLAAAILPVFAELRAGGARIALDDTGCGYADMRAVEILKPDFVKLCITIIRTLNRDVRVFQELKETIAYLETLGIRVLAEGVETVKEAETLRAFRIDYAQGWLYGKPLSAENFESTFFNAA